MRVGIVGAENEILCHQMKGVLERRGIEVVVIDTLKFPQELRMSAKNGNTIYKGESIDDINAYYIRQVYPQVVEEETKEGGRTKKELFVDYAARTEKISFLISWLRSLPIHGKFVANPVESNEMHFYKFWQLNLLRRGGIPVPKTLITNDPDEVNRFKKEVGDIVYKPLGGHAHTQEVKVEDLSKERLELLKNSPVTFQEYIPGENIRVYVVGKEVVLSRAIYSDMIDYRLDIKDFKDVELPSEVKEMCVRAMILCGMEYTGIDLKKTPEGKYLFLECNPSPVIARWKPLDETGVDEALADLLLGKRPRATD